MKRRSFFGLLAGALGVTFVYKKKAPLVSLDRPIQQHSWKVWEGFQPTYPDGHPSPLPSGYISMYAGEKVPEGWLPCDGSLVELGKYPKLCEILVPLKGNKLPDIPGHIIKT